MQHTASSHKPLDTAGFAHPGRNVGSFGIQEGMVVADFGAGSGAYVLAIAAVLAGSGKVYAIDVQKDLLRRVHNEATKRGYTNVHILWGDVEKPHGSKLADQSCDIVLISNIMFQVENKESVLREARRILRPRGSLIIIDWKESYGGMGPIHKRVFTRDAAVGFAELVGFKFAEEFEAGAHHYGVLFRAMHTN